MDGGSLEIYAAGLVIVGLYLVVRGIMQDRSGPFAPDAIVLSIIEIIGGVLMFLIGLGMFIVLAFAA